jgi:phospholipid/cholesterol/gamma-HCH transport system permease protein
MKGTMTVSSPTDESAILCFSGDWRTGAELPKVDEVLGALESKPLLRTVTFDASELAGWDSNLLTFLIKIKERLQKKGVDYRTDALPEGARRLLKLAAAVPERQGAKKESRSEPFLSRIGGRTITLAGSIDEVFDFLGDATTALPALFKGRTSFRRSDLFLFLQESGFQALPIVSLISMLFGLILAFVGAIQLQTFGAQIYVADLVGIAMVRIMGAVMTGIIMAGRTGASYAAQLGTMQVNEEIDALKTLGISPMEFLVLPRMLALTLMMPLLCVYADIMGILGGLIVGAAMLDMSPIVYLDETRHALSIANLCIGLFHSAVFGVIISLTGCLRGMQSGRSASAVGYATTSAVVTAIVSIVVATAVITVACNFLGI